MNNKIKKNIIVILGILVVLFAFIGIMVYLLVILVGGPIISSNSIIKKFEKNSNLFEQAILELPRENNIYVYMDHKRYLCINEELENGDNTKIIIEEQDFDKYPATIELFERLKVSEIFKEEDNNIYFQFNPSAEYEQCIVKVMDEKEYINSMFKFDYYKELNSQWRYVEFD